MKTYYIVLIVISLVSGCNAKLKNSNGATARNLARGCGHSDAVREARRAERFLGKLDKNFEPWTVRMYDFFCVYYDQLVEAFQRLDVDQSGTLMREDFVEALQSLYTKLPDNANLSRIVVVHFRDGNVDYREFLSGGKFIDKQYLMAAYESKMKKKKDEGKGGGHQRDKTKVVMPICVRDEGLKVADGGPPDVYVKKEVHVTDLARFNRDSQPRHPIEDDSAWYMKMPQSSRVHFRNLVRVRDVNGLRTAFRIDPEQLSELSESPTNRHELVDRFYKTPLMVACSRGDLSLVKLLVGAG